MAVSNEQRDNIFRLDDEEEGNRVSSSDFFFDKIGESVPLKPSGSIFDLESTPAQALAVSDRFRVIFLAHSEGFCVVKTKDAIELAKEIKAKGTSSCLQELSITDVHIGKVHILALSTDSSILAACVGGHLYFYSVDSLLNKDQEPSLIHSVGESSCIKDFQWRKKAENSYVVLSGSGMLYWGLLEGPLEVVMNDVDAVDWSVKGNFIAVARKTTLSVLSSKFEERFHITLFSKSCIGDSDPNCIIKVDSIKWVRHDCIILGSIRLTEDGKEDGYLVQVIASRDGQLSMGSSSMVLLSLNELFEGIIDDIVPFGGGPYLFLSYLDQRKLAIAANRKNTDQHIVLIGWLLNEEQKEAAVIDFSREKWIPRIELQENGDDNLIIGFGVDNVSIYESFEVKLGDEEEKVLSPFCILLCLTVEGKLVMFHVASSTETPPLLPVASVISDKEEDSPEMEPLGYEFSKTSTVMEQDAAERIGLISTSQGMEEEHCRDRSSDITKKNEVKFTVNDESLKSSFLADQIVEKETNRRNQEVKSLANLHPCEADDLENDHSTNHRSSGSQQSWFSPGQKSDLELPMKLSAPQGFGLDTDSFIGKIPSDTSSNLQSMYKGSLRTNETSKEFPGKVGSISSHSASSQSLLSGKPFSFSEFNTRFSTSVSSSIEGNKYENAGISMGNSRHVLGGPSDNIFDIRNCSTSSLSSVSYSGQKTHIGEQKLPAISREENIESLPAIRSSQIPSQESLLGKSLTSNIHPTKDYYITTSSGKLDSEAAFSKNFSSLKDMAKELDILLSCIEEEGGFKDACTIFQKSSVFTLEKGLATLSDRCRKWRNILEERIGEIQCLLDRTVDVLARKTHMEGIVKQASDSQYWELWNHQKLNPELELKQQHILKLNQDLTNQLIELEGHFNELEFNQFGEDSSVQMDHRAYHSTESSRSNQYLNRLNSTMNSQLAAAEQLSECLSKQMAVLRVVSPPMKRQNVAKELFEAIGLANDGDVFNTPDVQKTGHNPLFKPLQFSSCSDATEENYRRNFSSAKSYLPETVRRRRDSLDQSLASYEPPKTTIKRILLQEEHQTTIAHESLMGTYNENFSSQMQEGSAASHWKDHATPSSVNKVAENKSLKKASGSPSTSLFKWANYHSGSSESIGLRSPMVQMTQKSNLEQLSSLTSKLPPTIVQDSLTSTHETANIPGIGVTQTGKPYSITSQSIPTTGIESSFHTEVHLNQTQKNKTNLPTLATPSPKKSSEPSNLKSEEISQTKTAGSGKQQAVITGKSIGVPRRSDGDDSCMSSVPSATTLHEKAFHFDTATSKIQPDETLSASTVASTTLTFPQGPFLSPTVLPLSVTATSLSTPMSSTPSSSAMSFGGLLAVAHASTNVCQSLPSQSSSSTSSAPYSHASTTTQFLNAQILPSVPSDFMSSTLRVPSRLPVSDTSSRSDSNANSEGPTSLSGPPIEFSPNLEESVQPASATEASAIVASESNPTFSNIFTAASNVASNSQFELPSAVPVLSPPPFPTSNTAAVTTSENLCLTSIQEDEMEEEVPDTATELSLRSLDGFGIGSASTPAAAKLNPFGGPFANATANPASSAFTLAAPTGELFRPASFSFQSVQPSQQTNHGVFSGGFNIGAAASAPTQSGFGQPALIGPGQQALGSVLGTFGQSRQLGAGLPGSGFTSSFGSGGGFGSSGRFSGTHSSGGFINAPSGGSFTGIGSTAGGFAGVPSTGSGFAALASGGGGFAAAASADTGGFAGSASSGVGFSGLASGGGFSGPISSSGFSATASAGGGFGAFSNKQGGSGFSGFGNSLTGNGKSSSELFTQMRK